MKRNHAQVWVHQLSESSINKIWCSFHLSELLSFPLDRSASILPPSRLLGGITHWTVEKRKQRDCSLWGGPQVTHRLCLVSGLNCHSITGGTWVFSEIVPAPLTVRELLLKEKQWEFSLRGRGGDLTEQQANIHPGGSGETSKLPLPLQAWAAEEFVLCSVYSIAAWSTKFTVCFTLSKL